MFKIGDKVECVKDGQPYVKKGDVCEVAGVEKYESIDRVSLIRLIVGNHNIPFWYPANHFVKPVHIAEKKLRSDVLKAVDYLTWFLQFGEPGTCRKQEIVERSGISEPLVTPVLIWLRDAGYIRLVTLCRDNGEGSFAGSGYTLTEKGMQVCRNTKNTSRTPAKS